MFEPATHSAFGTVLGNPLIRLAMDACPAALLITDANGVILYVNRMFTRYTGFNAAEALGRTPRILKSGKTPPEVYAEMWATIRSGRPWRGRLLNRRKDRRIRLHGAPEPGSDRYWSHLSIAPILGSDQDILGYVAAHLDVTDQVRSEQQREFERNEARARAEVARILQGTGPLRDRLREVLAAIIRLDELHVQQRAGIFVFAPGRERLELLVTCGEFSDEFLEREACLAPGECLCGRAAAEGELLVSDECFHDPRHTHTFSGMTSHGHYIVPLRAGGEVLGVMFLYTDPHPSRDDTRMDTLRSVGDAIGVALANDQLTQRLIAARDEAHSASMAKGAFLANMSHEIRTPLTAILGFTELLAQDDAPEAERRDAVRTIHRNAQHLLELVNDLLDLSRIEAGKLPVDCEACCVDELLNDVVDLLRIRAASKGIALTVERFADLPAWIVTDPLKLRQVLVNLVGNAIKFTATGGVRLAARVAGQGDDRTLAFDVVDSGIGMTPEQAARLFHPFVQAEDSTTRKFGGTGLGLVISKRLARLLGGDVVLVRTQTGSGSHFRCTIPLCETEPVAAGPSAASAGCTAAPAAGLRGHHVLLVEDGVDNQRLIRAFLQRAGAVVTVAANGEEGIVCAGAPADPPYTAVLMDMQMPVVDGFTATRVLRARGNRLPIIALTADAMASTRSACLEAGCDDFATKPIDRGELIATILRVAGERSSA